MLLLQCGHWFCLPIMTVIFLLQFGHSISVLVPLKFFLILFCGFFSKSFKPLSILIEDLLIATPHAFISADHSLITKIIRLVFIFTIVGKKDSSEIF